MKLRIAAVGVSVFGLASCASLRDSLEVRAVQAEVAQPRILPVEERADAAIEAGETEEAVALLEQAITERESQLARGESAVHVLKALAYNEGRMGRLLISKPDLGPALEHLQRSKALWEEAQLAEPGSTEIIRHHYWAGLDLAEALTDTGDWHGASELLGDTEYFIAALEAVSPEAEAIEAWPHLSAWRWANLSIMQGKAEEALAIIEPAIAYHRARVERMPDDVGEATDLASAQSIRARALSGLGRHDEAVQQAREILEKSEQREDENPEFVTIDRALLGQMLLARRDAEEAAPLLGEALQQDQSYFRDDPSEDTRNALAWSHVLVGRAEEGQGNELEAQANYEMAVDLILPVFEGGGMQAARLNYVDTAAQALLEAGDVERAREFAEPLIDVGWRDPDFVRLVLEHELATEEELAVRQEL